MNSSKKLSDITPLTNLLTQRIKTLFSFTRFLLFRFHKDQGLPNAASLTFTTLLSLVPLMTVVLAIFTAFPMSGKVNQELQDFVFSNFVPTSGEVLQEYLQGFSSKASQLSGAGFAFLIITALMMMMNIDRAFNQIWRISTQRSPLNMFLEYWAVLSVGPILMAASVATTSYIVSIPILSEAASISGIETVNHLLKLAPLIASSIAFTLLYLVVPNRKVRIRHALAGGILAALLFELAKQGFAFYLTNFPSYEAIYGALAILPIFLVWIYLSWIVTLLGCEFTYCISVFKTSSVHSNESSNDFLLSLQILQQLWDAQKQGQSLSIMQLSEVIQNITQDKLESLLLTLDTAQFVLQTRTKQWALSRDLAEVSLLKLYHAHPYVLPSTAQIQQSTMQSEPLHQLIIDLQQSLNQHLSISVDKLFKA